MREQFAARPPPSNPREMSTWVGDLYIISPHTFLGPWRESQILSLSSSGRRDWVTRRLLIIPGEVAAPGLTVQREVEGTTDFCLSLLLRKPVPSHQKAQGEILSLMRPNCFYPDYCELMRMVKVLKF